MNLSLVVIPALPSKPKQQAKLLLPASSIREVYSTGETFGEGKAKQEVLEVYLHDRRYFKVLANIEDFNQAWQNALRLP